MPGRQFACVLKQVLSHSSSYPQRIHRTAHLEVVWWRQRPQGGGQDADGEQHRQISHGLAGAQRVGVGDSTSLTASPKEPWLDVPKKSRRGC